MEDVQRNHTVNCQMKSIAIKITMSFVVVLLVYNFAIIVLPLVSYDYLMNRCNIPNEPYKGECVAPADCDAFGKINDVTSLNSIERISFISQIRCRSERVCCPRNSDVYSMPFVNDTMKPRNRHASRAGSDAVSCGVQPFMPRIKGGQLAEIDEFPWMAMLLYQRDNNPPTQGCGGALISRTFVITAAHCVTGKDLEKQLTPLYVRLREYNIHTHPDCVLENNVKYCSDAEIDMTPKDIIPHPQYNAGSSNQEHDIALIRIDETPPLSAFLRPICLPEQNFENGATSGKKLFVSGWGRTDIFKDHLRPDVPSPIKLKLSLPYVERSNCNNIFQRWAFSLGPGQMCAGGERDKDTCRGDSGSPLMDYDFMRGVWYITGIVSLGLRECGVEGVPGVYTNVYHYLPWIKSQTGL